MKQTLILFIINITIFWLWADTVFAQNVSSKTYHVADGSSKQFVDILEQVEDGDTVILGSGRYHGNFHINKSILLMTHSKAVLTADNEGTILTISAPNTRVEGLTLQNSGNDISAKDACIFITEVAHGTQIVANEMSECGFAIWLDAASQVFIKNNTITGTEQAIVSDRGNGIHLFNTNDSIVEGNRIKLGRDGIYISNSENVLIKNNEMYNTRFGIHYMYSHNCQVTGNTISHSSVGAAVMFSKNIVVKKNMFERNKEHGLLLRDVIDSNIKDNTSRHNKIGLLLGSSYYNVIQKNCFSRNTMAAHVFSSDYNEVFDNDFIDNKLQLKFLSTQSIVWSGPDRGNYWSHYPGREVSKNGIGSKKFQVTNLSDWLSFSYPLLKIILHSPAMKLLAKFENEFPVLSKPAIIDNYPLMSSIAC
ncbi:MAG: nitrous oxide reductase family maturation protein NosD [Gammaproteobacteria bacterium]